MTSKAAQEFAGLQPMIARYFGSPTKVAAVAISVAKQVLAADTAPPRVQAQAPVLLQASPSKQAAPSLFVMPKPHPSFAPGTMVMRMQHSSPQK